MTKKEILIETMRREAPCRYFDQMLNTLDSIQQLKSKNKRKTLSYYKDTQIVAALRTHTLAHSGKFVLSVPKGLANTCPQTLTVARAIWGDNPLDDRYNLGNKESLFPMVIDATTFDLGIQVIDRVFRRYAECGNTG